MSNGVNTFYARRSPGEVSHERNGKRAVDLVLGISIGGGQVVSTRRHQ